MALSRWCVRGPVCVWATPPGCMLPAHAHPLCTPWASLPGRRCPPRGPRRGRGRAAHWLVPPSERTRRRAPRAPRPRLSQPAPLSLAAASRLVRLGSHLCWSFLVWLFSSRPVEAGQWARAALTAAPRVVLEAGLCSSSSLSGGNCELPPSWWVEERRPEGRWAPTLGLVWWGACPVQRRPGRSGGGQAARARPTRPRGQAGRLGGCLEPARLPPAPRPPSTCAAAACTPPPPSRRGPAGPCGRPGCWAGWDLGRGRPALSPPPTGLLFRAAPALRRPPRDGGAGRANRTRPRVGSEGLAGCLWGPGSEGGAFPPWRGWGGGVGGPRRLWEWGHPLGGWGGVGPRLRRLGCGACAVAPHAREGAAEAPSCDRLRGAGRHDGRARAEGLSSWGAWRGGLGRRRRGRLSLSPNPGLGAKCAQSSFSLGCPFACVFVDAWSCLSPATRSLGGLLTDPSQKCCVYCGCGFVVVTISLHFWR